MVPVLVASWRRASRLLQRGKCCRTRTVGPVGPWGHSSVSANFGTLWPCVMAVALSTVGPGRAAGNMAAVRLNRGSQHLSTEFHRNEPQDITRYTMLTLVLMRNNPSTLYALLKWKNKQIRRTLLSCEIYWNALGHFSADISLAACKAASKPFSRETTQRVTFWMILPTGSDCGHSRSQYFQPL